MPEFVAYYRVSTDRQGESGLGLEAQRSAVARFIQGASLLGEFQEIQSGKNHTNRPQLTAALAMCRNSRATLVIAKLDRLARDVHFISGLMKAGVDFVAVDMPQANKLTVHILAAVAEHEREAISQRTKAALQAAKARGTRLGNPRWKKSIERARTARNPVPVSPAIMATIAERRAQGLPLRKLHPKLLHVRILRTDQRIRVGPSQSRAVMLQLRHRAVHAFQLRLIQRTVPDQELVADFYLPTHIGIMS